MNREDIIRMAREVGFEQLNQEAEDWYCFSDDLERFVQRVEDAAFKRWAAQTKLAVEAERMYFNTMIEKVNGNE
jgi:hypothetical protein